MQGWKETPRTSSSSNPQNFHRNDGTCGGHASSGKMNDKEFGTIVLRANSSVLHLSEPEFETWVGRKLLGLLPLSMQETFERNDAHGRGGHPGSGR